MVRPLLKKHVLELPNFEIDNVEEMDPNLDFLTFTVLNLFDQEASVDMEELFPEVDCYKDPWKTDQRELLFSMNLNFEEDIEAFLNENSEDGVYKVKQKIGVTDAEENRVFVIKLDEDVQERVVNLLKKEDLKISSRLWSTCFGFKSGYKID